MLLVTIIICPIVFLFVVYGVIKDLRKQSKKQKQKREELMKEYGVYVPPYDEIVYSEIK